MRSNNGLAREHDRQVRLHSVRTDLELDLPPRIHLPDGEEYPYGSMAKLHLRNPEQVLTTFSCLLSRHDRNVNVILLQFVTLRRAHVLRVSTRQLRRGLSSADVVSGSARVKRRRIVVTDDVQWRVFSSFFRWGPKHTFDKWFERSFYI